MRSLLATVTLAFLGMGTPPAFAQAPPAEPAPSLVLPDPGGPIVRDEVFTSQALGRQMKFRVVLPPGYDRSARRYPVLYLLHGLMGSYIDWEAKTHLAEYVRGYQLIVVMPDAGDSWYVNSASVAADRFEDYVARDLVNAVDGRFRSIAARHGRAIAGLSMGGYGGLKFGLKTPDTFAFAAGFSAAMGMVAHLQDKPARPSPIHEAMIAIYGPAGSRTRADNDLLALARKAEPARLPYFYLDCGTEDGLLAGNREFVAVLQERKIAYEYRELPGEHTWAYWDQRLPEMLRVLAAHMDIGGRH